MWIWGPDNIIGKTITGHGIRVEEDPFYCSKMLSVWIPHYITVSYVRNRLANYFKVLQTARGPSHAQLLLIIISSHYGKSGVCNVLSTCGFLQLRFLQEAFLLPLPASSPRGWYHHLLSCLQIAEQSGETDKDNITKHVMHVTPHAELQTVLK